MIAPLPRRRRAGRASPRRSWPATSTGLRDACRDAPRPRGADRSRSRRSGPRGVRRLNRYVEEQAPWKLAKEAATRASWTQVLYSLAEGLRVISVLLHPYMPDATDHVCWTRSATAAARRWRSSARDFGAVRGRRHGRRSSPPLFPKVEAARSRRSALTPRQLTMLARASRRSGAPPTCWSRSRSTASTPMMIVFARVLLAALLLYVVIQMRGGERPRRAGGTCASTRCARCAIQGADQRRAAVLADRARRDSDQLRPDRDPDLARAAVRRAAGAADRPQRTGRPPRRGRAGDRLRRRGRADRASTRFTSARRVHWARWRCSAPPLATARRDVRQLKFRGVPPLVVSFVACVGGRPVTLLPALATLGAQQPGRRRDRRSRLPRRVRHRDRLRPLLLADRRDRRRHGRRWSVT